MAGHLLWVVVLALAVIAAFWIAAGFLVIDIYLRLRRLGKDE